MQATNDAFIATRRALDAEDYIDIIRRHKGWIIGPTLAALVVAVVVACLWPNTYVSEAIIRVQTPLVSEKYVPTNANMDVIDRINSMIPSVLRQESLQTIIDKTGIYKKERANEPPLDIVTKMQSHIDIGRVVSIQASGSRAPVPAFKVSFEYPDRRMAHAVTAELVGAFITEDRRTRYDRSTKTTGFLTDQTDLAKKELETIEARLAEFRIRNAGRLPDQLQSNLQTLRTFETQLSSVGDAIRRIDQDTLLLESQERIYRDQLQALTSPSERLTHAAKSERLAQSERDILQLETALAAYKERYTEAHPDVQALQSQLASLRKTREGLLKQEQRPAEAAKTDSKQIQTPVEARAQQQVEMNIASLHAQIEARQIEKAERLKEQKRLTGLINAYNGRIEAGPSLEQEFARLSRDLTIAKSRYEEVSGKKNQSEAATQLERQASGELLDVLQSPTMPQTPSKPNRYIIISVGTGLGFVLALFLVAAREVKDTSLKSLKDARIYTNLAVLGTVPLLENDIIVRRKRRLAWLAWSVACVLGIIAMSASFVYYYTTTKM